MEVYRNEIEQLRHYVVVAGEFAAADGVVMVRVFDPDGTEVHADEADIVAVAGEPTYYATNIGPAITDLESGYSLQWTYTVGGVAVVKTEELHIVTPYVPLSTLMLLPELAEFDTFALRKMERLVAGIIDVYTNQTFSRENDAAYIVLGQDSDSLALPKRLIELASVELLDGTDSITPYPLTAYVVTDPDRPWLLRRRKDFDVSRRLSPTTNYRFFKYPELYRVTGDWGWDYVPAEVTRAAEILVKEYFCEDSKYRDKYIANIRAGDWRMEFKVTGDETTGSANADMLLTGFRNVALAVI